MAGRTDAVIVIPTHNEAGNIGKLLEQILSLNLDLKVVVVDDSSPDKTADVVEQLSRDNRRIHLIRRNKKRSFGASYRDGFEYAFGLNPKYIFQMDADLSHPPEFILDFLKTIPDYDLVIGSRYLNGIRIINWSIGRLALSLFANRYIRIVLGVPFEDCTSGFRCWKAQALRDIRMKRISSNGYAFLVEMAYLAFKNRYRIKEIPIIFVERKAGDSKLSMKLIFESAFLPWRLRVRNIFLRSSIFGKNKKALSKKNHLVSFFKRIFDF